jgi:hypothetical protein
MNGAQTPVLRSCGWMASWQTHARPEHVVADYAAQVMQVMRRLRDK